MIETQIKHLEIIEPETVELFRGDRIYKAPFSALTASDATLANAVVRIGEIESGLKKLNIVK